ncbi:TetM/TetW/TetO/TetS family tetracycline resistance ribosomal protection protein [Paenibacillus sp. N1-5-1-14]|uniref:elongation factor G n=1 Tax=Paenibacillus radicibacter TaxID=2972488 RepID=UPI0021592CD5|nr:TetM/TetW/TetO/TetS family tetracycline resistance ribosomal protection protein [Paenibacillus radicibacter]MCR8644327.1 TetM/TetW/TetO/TetS family tetracycline resistance ribosomal protection protein [Paenibacillus radicibacter]
METINIGVLAHVDAGKTTLTERILFETGAITQVGSVDQGTTQTDSLAIERVRGITVKSSAVSFTTQGIKINLIDTPGHADFISEVEYALRVLDGVILVISAVEGVQAQTKVLMNALMESQTPVILFINKIDRMGANYNRVVEEIRSLLTEEVYEMCEVLEEGSPCVRVKHHGSHHREAWLEQLTRSNDSLLSDYMSDSSISVERLDQELRELTLRGKAFPLFAGSAVQGIGVQDVITALGHYFPKNSPTQSEQLTGVVFKVKHSENGERLAYVRIYEGRIIVKKMITYLSGEKQEEGQFKLHHLEMLLDGQMIETYVVHAGDIAVLRGTELHVGDIVGHYCTKIKHFPFHEPPLQIQVSAEHSKDTHLLFKALSDLAIEDPFIQFTQDAVTKELTIRMFGEVQQEIIATTLSENYGIRAKFSEPLIMCIEKPLSTGSAAEFMGIRPNPFYATIGFRVEPGEFGTGVVYRLEVELGSLPLTFQKVIQEKVMEVLQEGLSGWPVTDIVVTLTHSGYASPVTTAADFRNLVPLVLMHALHEAGTRVYEPYQQYEMLIPESSLSKCMSMLASLEASIEVPQLVTSGCLIRGTIPVRRTEELKRSLKSITVGEGFFTARPGGYQSVQGIPIEKQRRTVSPLNRKKYMMVVSKVIGRES